MRTFLLSSLSILFSYVAFVGSSAFAAEGPLLGFDAAASDNQHALETEFDSHIDRVEMDRWMRDFSSEAHHVGSPKGKENADAIAALFRGWNYEVEIAEYQVLFPEPLTRELELLSPARYTASLTEDSLDEDPSTSVIDDLLPPYNAFSIDGDVEGELVFVNYGTPADYELLDRYGISVAGKIAISKYGGSWRGIKPKLAGEKGAIATLIYSDPADDGYGPGDVYPTGPFKNESGVQRGSVMDMPTYPGDVLTPGIGATGDARRLPIADAPTITRIPVLPISYRDALPLLEAMGGEVVPREWRGGLPITYHLGPGPARVRLQLEFDWKMVTAYNVIARLPGALYPDEWVIRGNHHDGWNHGAADPISGLVALLAEAKALGALAAAGNPPARTVIYGAWDAEEPGLIGSTEWAEHHAAELQEHAVAYLNTDGNGRGFVNVGGSHVLESFFNEVMRDVEDPQTGVSVQQRRRANLRINAGSEKVRTEAKNRANLRISPLGSGSDYTPFLQHLGIASANISFGGESAGGSYHTMYDTYEHYSNWIDPGLVYGEALAQVAGHATLRLANAPRLPFEFSGFSDNVSGYIEEIEELAETMRSETEADNQNISDGSYDLVLDPNKTFGPPIAKEPVPFFNFAPLKNALARLEQAASSYDSVIADGAAASARENYLLYTSERELTRQQGLSGRPWYKHHIYAPGFYTGYGVKTIPGVREAIEQRQYDQVAGQIDIAAEVLNAMASRVELLVEE
ncbi:MAG: transferrin receptor-like dimerization domain-containing protein [Gammaproteobacteria bacterium]|jgi:N-acetylated-alpha-linked acidic dipeptidase|nr:folate hydrolase [Gammaproteobacteria bacterium]MDP6094465.1 transferrin receptor-like dimerization domain-containing protein [Gammaproteobacteria bacterium]HJO10633.1 transferrin receptor-like dimerization domain-containing protein [Gammaproteobacteria bacterium]